MELRERERERERPERRQALLTRVAVRQQGADGEQHLGDGERRAPVVLQDVQADHALTVDVAVIDPRAEGNLWRGGGWGGSCKL